MLFGIESFEDQKRQIDKAIRKLEASFALNFEFDKFGRNEDIGTFSIKTVKKINITPSSEQKIIIIKESFDEFLFNI